MRTAGRDRRLVRCLAVAISALMVASLAAWTELAFLAPPSDRPERADAVVILGGDGDRVGVARRLVDAGYSSVAVLSVSSLRSPCPASVPGRFEVTCFVPEPFSTQGEARYVAALARRQGWARILVVSGHAQTDRARLRIERCWRGQVLMEPAAAVPRLLTRWHDVAYEWAATIKAEVWQRSC